MRWKLSAMVLAMLATIMLAPAPASAHPGGPPKERLICSPTNAWSTDGYVRACFEVEGDDFWVYDGRQDDASAVVIWGTDNGQGGSCRNSHGYGTWHECKYDMFEGVRVDWDHWTYDADTDNWQRRSGGYYTFA
jgi:hypothetical protein